jgi:hypothetical protein
MNRKSDQYATDTSNNALYMYYLLIEYASSNTDIESKCIYAHLYELHNTDIQTAEQFEEAVDYLLILLKSIATQ